LYVQRLAGHAKFEENWEHGTTSPAAKHVTASGCHEQLPDSVQLLLLKFDPQLLACGAGD